MDEDIVIREANSCQLTTSTMRLIICLLFIPVCGLSQVPEISQDLITKLESWEAEQKAQLNKQIEEKRKQVVSVLRKHLEETTKSGNLEGALAINTEIERLSAGTEPAKPVKEAQKVDRTNPRAVAEAFWEAVLAHQWENAAQFVHEDDREWFFGNIAEGELKELPNPPKVPVIEVKTNGGLGSTNVPNWLGPEGGIEINEEDGIWWIEN